MKHEPLWGSSSLGHRVLAALVFCLQGHRQMGSRLCLLTGGQNWARSSTAVRGLTSTCPGGQRVALELVKLELGTPTPLHDVSSPAEKRGQLTRMPDTAMQLSDGTRGVL